MRPSKPGFLRRLDRVRDRQRTGTAARQRTEIEQLGDRALRFGQLAEERRLAQQHAEELAIRRHALDDALEKKGDGIGLGQPQRPFDRLLDRGAERAESALRELGEDRLATREELVERPDAHARSCGDVIRGEAGEAALLENPSAALDECIAGRPRAGLSRALSRLNVRHFGPSFEAAGRRLESEYTRAIARVISSVEEEGHDAECTP
jgi:hypothetical protein